MKKILLIEDEEALQKALSDTLSDEYEVINALDGEIGFNLAKREKPDLIMLDLILPKMDGFEVLEKIKQDEEIKEIPVVIMTNLESNMDVDKALELGATTYLVKANYELSEIVDKIKKSIGE